PRSSRHPAGRDQPLREPRLSPLWDASGLRPSRRAHRPRSLLLQAPRRGGPVILFPAIDLKGGACVRLVRGEMASATVFNDDPAAQAQAFADLGFRWLHVVDLDGAFAGKSVNGEAVRAIRRGIDLRMQLGGGIRDRAAIDYWLGLGIDR